MGIREMISTLNVDFYKRDENLYKQALKILPREQKHLVI